MAADTGTRLRSTLEHFQLQEGGLEPGTTRSGYIYLKSKKHGRKLSGYLLQLDGLTITLP